MIETIGVHTGSVPTPADVLKRLRALTAAAGVVLIFDEVVTGFRVSPGGAQGLYCVTPDLTLLGKVVAGGFPGGAVAGRSDILEWLDFDAAARTGREKIAHQGTFNANPVSAAAGIATLGIVRDSDACARAAATAGAIRNAHEPGARGRRNPVGRLRRIVGLSHLHQPRWHCPCARPGSTRARFRPRPSATIRAPACSPSSSSRWWSTASICRGGVAVSSRRRTGKPRSSEPSKPGEKSLRALKDEGDL